jgi:ADP-heptose:LPS heptosyltransferase
MADNFAKRMEKKGKELIFRLTKALFSRSALPAGEKLEIKKLLIFRLDGRIGNGLMLLPLANAIRKTSPEIHSAILINHVVAPLFSEFQNGQFDKVWSYDQHYLLKNPLRFIRYVFKLRKEKYDVVLNSTNPNSFSISQAIYARMIGGKFLVGFKTGKSNGFYDAEVQSSLEKHYSMAMLDLWKYFYPEAPYINGGLKLPEVKKKNKILFWLGATGGKHLKNDMVEKIAAKIKEHFRMEAEYAAGPADRRLLKDYSEAIRGKTMIIEGTLQESALFFKTFALFVSTDTGPMHLAAAIGMPTFTVFTKKSNKQYGYHDGIKHFSYYISPDAPESAIEKITDTAFPTLKDAVLNDNTGKTE